MRIVLPQLLRVRPSSIECSVLPVCSALYRPVSPRYLRQYLSVIRRKWICNSAIARKQTSDDTGNILPKQLHNDEHHHAPGLSHRQRLKTGHGRSPTNFQSDDFDVAGWTQQLSKQERQDPTTWIELIERYLPIHLRQLTKEKESVDPIHSSLISGDILGILHTARKPYNSGISILAFMMTGTWRKAALWLCDVLLKNSASKSPSRPMDLLPSNILWPNEPLFAFTGSATSIKQVNTVLYDSYEKADKWELPIVDPRYKSHHPSGNIGESDNTMDEIWSTLGNVVVLSANMARSDADKAMNAVQLVLSSIHNLNLVPDNVYAYKSSPLPTTIQRPPLMHLVSSGILTALSDASWREQQDENIQKAASHGLSYKEIGRDPPGGRFRLKVSPLGPEVWLEFILWCCIEGGFVSAGARIINLLQRDTHDPWFAVTWSNDDINQQARSKIKWEGMKSRTDKNATRNEDYNTVKPFAVVPARTISTETILALVEGHIDAIRPAKGGPGMTLEAAQHGIIGLLSFLEPHDLPIWYFDYISSRLMQTEAFDEDRSKMMRKWFDRLSFLRSMKSARQLPPPQISFQYSTVLRHSEFTAGFLHQVLDGFVQENNIHDALKAFNDLQKLVDTSKLHAIASFLQRMYSPSEDFFTSRYFASNPEFVSSHGQLPLHKLVGLLQLATNTNLIGFGQWLLYSDDPDGPLIPPDKYGSSAVARALVNFAALSNDTQLLEDVLTRRESESGRLQTVNFLRTIFNAKITLLDFNGASNALGRLGRAQGGGFGLSNLASLAGMILKLENDAVYIPLKEERARLSNRAASLLHEMLGGHVSTPSGVMQQLVRTKFKQQVSQLLTVFEAFPDSNIATCARGHWKHFRTTNVPDLNPSIFNIFLEAAMEAKGAKAGVAMVDSFCTTDNSENWQDNVFPEDHTQKNEVDPKIDMHNPFDQSHTATTDSLKASALSQAFVPFADDLTTDDKDQGAFNEAFPSPATQYETTGDRHNRLEEQTESNPREQIFASPYFPTQEETLPSARTDTNVESETLNANRSPVCIADYRTIRLIVRKASREKRAATTEAARDDADDILRWARRRFVELGATSTMINNEIREPIAEAKMPSSTKHKPPAKVVRRLRESRPSSISKSFSAKLVSSKTT